jgi:ABC-type transport system involved in multi-copper enzyme maturation permease subunit
MTVHSLGYRPWSGPRDPAWHRPLVIATTGVRCAWQSSWLHRIVLFSWLPASWFAIGFFVWEQSLLFPDWSRFLQPFLSGAPAELRSALAQVDDIQQSRHTMWAWLLQAFFGYTQVLLMVLVVGLIAPRLISQDFRSRAFLLYFSRPLDRAEYILGKLMTVWFYLLVIATAPALVLYVGGVLLSSQVSVLAATWDLPLRILGASAVLAIPTASLALCFSSMTQESRYASFAWFNVWILGWVTYGALTSADAVNRHSALDQPSRWTVFSLYHLLGRVQSWIFGFAEFSSIRLYAFILIIVTVVSLALLYRRVSAPMRA